MNSVPCECISVISQQWHVYCSSLPLVPPHGFLCDMIVSVCQVPTCVTILVAPNVTYQPLVNFHILAQLHTKGIGVLGERE